MAKIINDETIVMGDKEWDEIKLKIRSEIGNSGLITWVMKREYGFTPRYDFLTVYLDFYDPKMLTYFRMKFL
jgi:hypothetical protein